MRIKSDWPAAKVKLAAASAEPDKTRLLREAAVDAQRNPEYWKLLAETLAAAQQYGESYKAWGAAERAARDDAERAKMRLARLALENAKLDFEDSERLRKKDEEARDLERIKADSLRSIRLAESAANEKLGGADGPPKPVAWWEDPKNEFTVAGSLERVDCAAQT